MVPIGQAGAEMKQNDIKYGEKAGAAFVQRTLLFYINRMVSSRKQKLKTGNRNEVR